MSKRKKTFLMSVFKMSSLLITICGRGGSKGIPGKNIRKLAGKELIAYSIKHAQKFKSILEEKFQYEVTIELSTDDQEIKSVAEKHGLKTDYLRPDFLANDSAGKLDVIKDILSFREKKDSKEFDLLLDLDISAPMRTIEDLTAAFNDLMKNDSAENLFSVRTANKNPYFNMVEEGEDGFYQLSKSAGQILSRQKAPKVYEMNASFYLYRRSFFNREPLNLFNSALIYNMQHMSFDLDHIVDFEFLDFLVLNKKLDFNI
jgi:CMP-N,N'-diacetyllegionaminic acid synthase